MPKDPRIKKVLVIGSGPIIIGQAAEFDYSGTQACRALKSEGVETILVNSNPATIMTDPDIADHVYIEPLTAEVIERIIEKEKPDAILPNLGGQMGLNLSMELARNGFLDRSGVRLLACKPDTIDRAEDRQLFKDTMEKLHQPIIPSKVVEDLDDALDFAHVLGQHAVKRALEIAAAGGHNVLLSGPPGSGKSMAAKRFSTILPPLSDSERLEVIRVWSAIGRGQEAVERAERPFRAPHHNSSANAMAGGSGAAGRLPVPGEITLAHRGVLFLDEFPEFRRDVLETLRQPLEDGRVTISRVAGQVTYPARFQLIAAMNPCKCGWYGTERCTCTKAAVQQYLHRLSGPLLDRIDLQVAVQPVEYAALAARGQASEEHSADIRARVLAARERQYARQGADVCNAAIPPPQLAEHCPLSADASRMFAAAFQRLGLTARAHDRVLRVARTIADLADSSVIEAEHLAEALQYRSLDRAAGS